ncbi:MAG: hypothetical protein JWO11_3660 [Nocardioides sp.]|nr:hypothetical protein [Nocardioides sp.]
MNDFDILQRVDEALDRRVPDSPLPIDDLLRRGKVAHRRKSRRTVAGAVAVTVLTVVGGMGAQQVIDDEAEPSKPGLAATEPMAPVGAQLVGRGRVVVAVPQSWSLEQKDECNDPPFTVFSYFDAARFPTCNAPFGQGVSSLRVTGLQTPLGRSLLPRMRDAQPLGESPVVQTAPACSGMGSRGLTSGPVCMQYFAVPDENVLFSVTVFEPLGRGDLDSIRNSLQLLPEGYTTVPYAIGKPNGTVGNQLLGLGLVAHVVGQGGPRSVRAAVVRTSPPAGSVVAEGDTVQLVVE